MTVGAIPPEDVALPVDGEGTRGDPEEGEGHPVLDQFGANIRELRERAGMAQEALSSVSSPAGAPAHNWVGGVEAGRHRVGTLKALSLAGSLGVTIDVLTERIFWNPGEVAARPGDRAATVERMAGFFSVVPAGPIFEETPSPVTVKDHAGVAAVIGRNVLSARRRRHLRQIDLGIADVYGPTLIERGERVPRLEALLAIARALEVPPAFLLAGMAFELDPVATKTTRRPGASVRHLYDPVERLWLDDRTVIEIAEVLSITRRSVEGVIRRMRAEGHFLPYRGQGRGEAPPAVGPTDREDDGAVCDESQALARIAANLRDLRGSAGISGRQLGEAAELPTTTVLSADSGGSNLPFTVLLRLAAGLRVPPSTVTAGVGWDPARRLFVLTEPAVPPRVETIPGQNVRGIRRGLGTSQARLAARVGILRRSLSAIETGDYTPKPVTLLMLAAGLGVEVSDLLEGVSDWYVRPLPAAERADGDEPPSSKERWVDVARMWSEGRDVPGIAEALDMTSSAVRSAVSDMRDGGVDLAYRRPPLDRTQLSARLRRRRANRPGSRRTALKRS